MAPKRKASSTFPSPDPKSDNDSRSEPDTKSNIQADPSDSNPTIDPYPALHSQSLRMSYHIARGEVGVLTFEPYKSILLPLWRFRTPTIARKSSSDLWSRFLDYDRAGDFVGMDMARKFIQMGMTRAKRYANYKGGRKYKKDESGGRGEQLEKGLQHEGKGEKEESSRVFREVWERCRGHEGYREKKEGFMREQREWEKGGEGEGEIKVKSEEAGEAERERRGGSRKKVKKEEVDD